LADWVELCSSEFIFVCWYKGVDYLGVKVFNKPPQHLKEEVDNSKKFKQSLKNYLRTKTFYSLKEYFES